MNSLAEIPKNVTIAPVTPMDLIQRAAQSGASIEQMQQLFELKLRVEADEARKAFGLSMAKFKDNPPQINKNRHVKFTTSKGVTEYDHATLDHVVDMIAPALAVVGIRHRWEHSQTDVGWIAVTCILSNELGHEERTTLRAQDDQSGGKNSIQAVVSTKTYLERHTLLSATGLAAKDTDNDARSTVPKSVGMPEPELLSAIVDIENAAHVTELHTIYAAHYKKARSLGDQDAMNQLLAAKDKRKEELK